MADVRKAFEQPGSAYRGKPFWAWNGRLEADELRRQVRVMHRMGLGGFFMHSRVGLGTAYLSEEWFDMVRACVDEARKLGMEAWLYDEDRWPSGAAGGLVTSDPRYRHRSLRMDVCAPAEAAGLKVEPLAVFRARVDGNRATDVERLPLKWSADDVPDGAKVLVFHVKADGPSSWFNDAAYLDTMSHEAVQKFIEVTHEAYRREVGEDFGRLVPGIFTDEPHHGGLFGSGAGHTDAGSQVPWTGRLPEVFRERYGYDILDHLPAIYYNVDGREVCRERLHYHDCATFLFTDAFARQIGEWCQENGILFTGHVLMEENLRSQANVGGAAMRFYEHMQAPGIDVLTEHSYRSSTAKQCSSVLHQTGRRWMLSELYGCTGWDFPFEGHKAVGDWQAALGVNLRCQHLAWYTMSGEAKRDYPASIFYQSPWWEQYGKVEDYFARVGAVLTAGEPVRRLLVVHPIESCWARATVGWYQDERIDRQERQFRDLLHWLLEEHVDFDYGDEEMMGRLARVRRGKTPALVLGKAAYDVVLVPPLDTVRSSTLKLLKRFAKAGGAVVFCTPVAPCVDAEESRAAAATAAACKKVRFERAAVAKAVAAARAVSVRDGDGAEKAGVLCSLHREGEELRLFLCNTDRSAATGPLTVQLRGRGSVQLWDAETGRRWAVASRRARGAVRFETSMPPSGSRIYVLTKKKEKLPPAESLRELRAVSLGRRKWTSELTDHNVLVLDVPEFRIGRGKWRGPLEVLKADAEMRHAIGLPWRGGSMVQPWARKKADGPSRPIALRYRVQVDAAPRGAVFLAIEQPDRFDIRLNGNPVSVDADCGWWVDRSIRVLPLDAGALVRGENELLLSGMLDDGCNLEAAFLLGDFAVAVKGARARITGALGEVGFGDWTGQGLPFYSGSVVYRTWLRPKLRAGQRAFVEVPQFAGACVRVLVDGAQAGVIGWQPHEVEVTELLAGKKEAELAVEVIAHRRNAFGPLHNRTARPRWVGPGEFVSTGKGWQDAYNLLPAGCMSAPRLSVRRS